MLYSTFRFTTSKDVADKIHFVSQGLSIILDVFGYTCTDSWSPQDSPEPVMGMHYTSSEGKSGPTISAFLSVRDGEPSDDPTATRPLIINLAVFGETREQRDAIVETFASGGEQ